MLVTGGKEAKVTLPADLAMSVSLCPLTYINMCHDLMHSFQGFPVHHKHMTRASVDMASCLLRTCHVPLYAYLFMDTILSDASCSTIYTTIPDCA